MQSFILQPVHLRSNAYGTTLSIFVNKRQNETPKSQCVIDLIQYHQHIQMMKSLRIASIQRDMNLIDHHHKVSLLDLPNSAEQRQAGKFLMPLNVYLIKSIAINNMCQR